MSRAVFVFRSKEELEAMGVEELFGYIATLRSRAAYLRGAASKETEKALEVAERVLEARKSS